MDEKRSQEPHAHSKPRLPPVSHADCPPNQPPFASFPNTETKGAYYGFHGVVSFFDSPLDHEGKDGGEGNPALLTPQTNGSCHLLNNNGHGHEEAAVAAAAPAVTTVLDPSTHLQL